MTISLNENLKTRRKQLAILAAVIIGGAAAAGRRNVVRAIPAKTKATRTVATPNLTGVVTATFNEQVNDAALTQQQAKTSA